MTNGQLLIALLAGAAVLALWVDMRLGQHAPQTLTKVVLHCACSMLVVNLTGALAPAVISHGKGLALVALFAIVLPGWIYPFLASIWFIKIVRDALPR